LTEGCENNAILLSSMHSALAAYKTLSAKGVGGFFKEVNPSRHFNLVSKLRVGGTILTRSTRLVVALGSFCFSYWMGGGVVLRSFWFHLPSPSRLHTVNVAALTVYNNIKERAPCPEYASELYRQSDHSLSAKLVPTFEDRGCCVVITRDP
jgi:hypothetical protein